MKTKKREDMNDDSGTAMAAAASSRDLHRPYASMNWIRFNGSLRVVAESQPLDGTPLVNLPIKDPMQDFVKSALFASPSSQKSGHGKLTSPFMGFLFFKA